MNRTSLPSSFRDPSGFVFRSDEKLYRQVNQSYRTHYDHLISSGLYASLTGDGLLVPHVEVGSELAQTNAAYKIIEPERVPFISYPYEWSFSQHQDAAQTMLTVQKRAFEFGMTLKDSSAYNIQFVRGKPLLIDTLSFELYRPGQVWVPYRQYCQQFLAPLALMSKRDARLKRLLRIFLDGIPLDLAAALLPARTKLSFGLLTHIHLHARAQARYAGRRVPADRRMSRTAFRGLIDSLETTTRRLRWEPKGTEWANYYQCTNYSAEGLEDKAAIVGEFLERTRPATLWDLGANTGMFSRVAIERGVRSVISFDSDSACVERNYLQCKRSGETRILPLLLDLTNPSPGLGWAHEERASLLDRGPADAVLALALVHHLAIGNNVPLGELARTLARMGRILVIEFADKRDSMVQRLLASREDVFGSYTTESFESEFGQVYDILAARQPAGSVRTIYLMRRKG